jgi:hypothetical protein
MTPGFRHAAPVRCAALILPTGGPSQPRADPPPLLNPDAPEWTARAPVRRETQKGHSPIRLFAAVSKTLVVLFELTDSRPR